MKRIFMVIGCPGSGKTWVCERLAEKFTWVKHDDFLSKTEDAYVEAIIDAERATHKSLIIEAPFSMSSIIEPLKKFGFDIIPIFIQEDPKIIIDRYFNREKRELPKGHLTRQNTYAQRARDLRAFAGTSVQVLDHLKNILA